MSFRGMPDGCLRQSAPASWARPRAIPGLRTRSSRLRLRNALTLTALATLAVQSVAAADSEGDWEGRSRGPGVFYADNFSGIDGDEELRRRSYVRHRLNPTRLFVERANTLSGGGAARIEVHPQDDESTATYAHSFDGVGTRSKNVKKKALYYQFSVYLPNYMLDHRFKTVKDRSSVGLKWAILQEPDQSFGRGEIVVKASGFTRIVSAYTVGPKGTHGFGKKWPSKSGNPCNRNTPDYQWQATIDAGPQKEGIKTDATSCDLFRRRYGMFYSYYRRHPPVWGEGTLTEQGYPEPESARSAILWVPDAWNVIEIYVNEPEQTVKMWHAKRGDPPRLVVDAVGTADMGTREGNYTGAQLLPRLEQRAPDPGRETTYAIYDEIIASTEPIPFPGGHSIEAAEPPTAPQP